MLERAELNVNEQSNEFKEHACNECRDTVCRPIERRSHPRAVISLTIRLSSLLIAFTSQSTTKDVSCGGFYCFASRPFSLGELLGCVLAISGHSTDSSRTMVCLHGKARVVRVEILGDGAYGIACCFDNYRVVRHEIDESPFLQRDPHFGPPVCE